jgi:hypothetical protein
MSKALREMNTFRVCQRWCACVPRFGASGTSFSTVVARVEISSAFTGHNRTQNFMFNRAVSIKSSRDV